MCLSVTELRQFGINPWFTQQPVCMLNLVFVRVDRLQTRDHGSGSLSPAPDLRVSISILGLHKDDLWWTKCRWNRLF